VAGINIDKTEKPSGATDPGVDFQEFNGSTIQIDAHAKTFGKFTDPLESDSDKMV
jgi:hypothetical protein